MLLFCSPYCQASGRHNNKRNGIKNMMIWSMAVQFELWIEMLSIYNWVSFVDLSFKFPTPDTIPPVGWSFEEVVCRSQTRCWNSIWIALECVPLCLTSLSHVPHLPDYHKTEWFLWSFLCNVIGYLPQLCASLNSSRVVYAHLWQLWFLQGQPWNNKRTWRSLCSCPSWNEYGVKKAFLFHLNKVFNVWNTMLFCQNGALFFPAFWVVLSF